MLSLARILLEIGSESNHTVFITGPSGAGKTTIISQLPLNNYNVINVDDVYEKLLKQSGIGMKQKDFGPEQLSKAAQLYQQARKSTTDKHTYAVQNKQNIIIDSTGGASKPLLKKKQELESAGYKTFMVGLYVSPITSLERNLNRERNLMPAIVVRNWRDYNKNINIYRHAFGNNFVLLNNDPQGIKSEYNLQVIKKRFFDTTSSKGKDKTPEELAKSNQEKEQINQEIQQLIKIQHSFDSLELAKSKLNKFNT